MMELDREFSSELCGSTGTKTAAVLVRGAGKYTAPRGMKVFVAPHRKLRYEDWNPGTTLKRSNLIKNDEIVS
jgi:hypothetical protein